MTAEISKKSTFSPSLLTDDPIKGSGEAVESFVTGNESIKILKHQLSTKSGNASKPMPCVNLAIQNCSDATIASVIFEAAFYDPSGKELGTAKHLEVELKPHTSRAVTIAYTQNGVEKPAYYHARIKKMLGAGVEKVQLRQHEVRTKDDGAEEVRGMVKNISASNTDAALVASWVNGEMEKIGSKVILLRGIEPDGVREFHFRFKPPQGEQVLTYSLSVVCDVETP